MYAPRPVVDRETFDLAALAATDADVPVRLFIDACIEAHVGDTSVQESARRELAAWSDGSAVTTEALVEQIQAITQRDVLLLAASNYRRQPPMGIPATETSTTALAELVRQPLPIRPPSDAVTVVAFRRGLPRLLALADRWKPVKGSHKHRPESFLVAESGRWVDTDNRRRRLKMAPEDRALATLLSDLVLAPTGNRNMVTWVRAN